MIPLSETVIASPPGTIAADLKVSDAVWVGTALLHEGTPDAEGFTVEEIAQFVARRQLTKGAYRSILQHVSQHCVANRKPQPNRARMLFALEGGQRRLFRTGDWSDPGRKDAPSHPEWSKLPSHYKYLNEWYERWGSASSQPPTDPLLRLVGTGRGMYGDKGADAYVAGLRDGWDNP